jgi:hypothetical protein
VGLKAPGERKETLVVGVGRTKAGNLNAAIGLKIGSTGLVPFDCDASA